MRCKWLVVLQKKWPLSVKSDKHRCRNLQNLWRKGEKSDIFGVPDLAFICEILRRKFREYSFERFLTHTK